MAIFAIIKQTAPVDNLASAIRTAFPLAHYDLGDGAWLVAASTTAMELSEKLGITECTNGSAVIVEAASYYGRANPAVWSWIKANWEGTPLG